MERSSTKNPTPSYAAKLATSVSLMLLDEFKSVAANYLWRGFAAVLDDVDAKLADVVDRPNSSRVYVYIRWELRNSRQRIELRFKNQILEIFKKKPSAEKQWSLNTKNFGLSLLEEHELDETVAIRSMVSRLKIACKQEIFELSKRIQVVFEKSRLECPGNPLSAEAICNAIKESLATLNIQSQFSSELYKLFDEEAFINLAASYRQMNAYLIEKGVMPTIKSEIVKSPITSMGQQYGSLSQTTQQFALLQQLMMTTGMRAANGFAQTDLIIPSPFPDPTPPQPIREILSSANEFPKLFTDESAIQKRDEIASTNTEIKPEEDKKQLIDIAKAKAREVVNKCTEQNDLPAEIFDFLHEHWQKVLALSYIEDRGEGEKWKAAVRAVKHLIWSLKPKQTVEAYEDFIKKSPELFSQLRQGLTLICVPWDKANVFFRKLMDYHATIPRPAPTPKKNIHQLIGKGL